MTMMGVCCPLSASEASNRRWRAGCRTRRLSRRRSSSGGCVEAAVVQGALEVIRARAPRMLEFGVSEDDAWAVGLACGGRIQVYVEPVE